MINAVIGNIVSLDNDKVIIRCGYIEYSLFVSTQTLSTLSNLQNKNEVRIVTVLQHREDSMTLFGFIDDKEREVFLQLQTVPGIAAKGALKILSGISLNNLIINLDEGNIKALSKIPGIGAKTAQRLVLTLRGKLVLEDDMTEVLVTKNNINSPYNDLANALSDMGYDRASCERVIKKIVKEFENELLKLSNKDKEQFIFKHALKALN
ncbi:MAG: Holliday junction branch migration protein RuvA [Spirochaetaceae bacterium]|nr:Holliday junction branch migration protein RuvA [Spirochaetaceae bacterium]